MSQLDYPPREYPGQAPCYACEGSGYEWEHGNDWDSGPWSHQTNVHCEHCNGTGVVDAPLVTLEELEFLAEEEAAAKCHSLTPSRSSTA